MSSVRISQLHKCLFLNQSHGCFAVLKLFEVNTVLVACTFRTSHGVTWVALMLGCLLKDSSILLRHWGSISSSTQLPCQICPFFALFLLAVRQAIIFHETLTQEERTNTFSQTKLLCHNTNLLFVDITN